LAGVLRPRRSAWRTARTTWSGSIPHSAASTMERAAAVSRMPSRTSVSSRRNGRLVVCTVTPGGPW